MTDGAIDRLKEMVNKPFLYQNEEVVILNYCKNTVYLIYNRLIHRIIPIIFRERFKIYICPVAVQSKVS